MEYLLDESSRQQLMNLLPDGPMFLLVESAQALFHGFGAGWMSKECSATSLGIPGMSEGLNANMSAFARRKSTSTTSYLGSMLELILNALPSEVPGSRKTSLVPSAGSKLPA